jgi:hypothetical protein
MTGTVTARPSPHFPGQYAFKGLIGFPVVIGTARAFHDHGIVPPADIRDRRYPANSQAVSAPYPYPFMRAFVIPRVEVGGFVKANNLHYAGGGSYWPSPDVDVLTFAQHLGWHSPDNLAHWYYNTGVYNHTEIVDDYQG